MNLNGYILAFDLDGTLVDSAPDIISALNKVLQEQGITPFHLDEARPMIGRGAMELLRRAYRLAGHPLAPEDEAPLLARLLDLYEVDIDTLTRPFEGLVEALDELEAMGARFCICTNKHTRLSVLLIEKLGLTARFGSNRGSDSVEAKKPAAGHLQACIDDMGGDIRKVIMIGDSETDFLTAQNAGVPSILVTFGYSEGPIRELAADAFIDHYRDFVPAVKACINSQNRLATDEAAG
ncbi:phosphoglycolate phosphatase, bacterial [Asticcacaulis biprosthecium C19]|uniref:phosphoglycolate phosphatase n=1 Tax=Asticcacaulis biprosthecium C19 TaxID=715226 RepID=F4QPR7_9CAUL|nr:HAD-IA family hydrolase [Asticcacaulis biprosthecium]EGF90204.1 phosphoglycolate phosphatase, bacterial [Asticcacaulis biprosthecium C19]